MQKDEVKCGNIATNDKASKGGATSKQRDKIIDVVMARADKFWCDRNGNPFITLTINGITQRLGIRSEMFDTTMRRLYGEANKVPVPSTDRMRYGSVSDAAMGEAKNNLATQAYVEGRCDDSAIRSCHTDDGKIIVDLGDQSWRAVKISKDGWEVIPGTTAPLIRPAGMLALPEPKHDPTALPRLRAIMNFSDEQNDADFKLGVLWFAFVLWGKGPYPVLAFDGEQGSGKSTVSRMAHWLVDPNNGALRTPPEKQDDLTLALTNSHLVSFDNVSLIDHRMADDLCSTATGRSFGKRKLYSNNEESLVFVQNPVLLNGIPALLTRPDLADRAIAITLPAIPDNRRRTNDEVWNEFKQIAPGVLAQIFDANALALKVMPDVRLSHLPRMADFARFIFAAAPAFGWTGEEVLAAFDRNRSGLVQTALESSALTEAIVKIGQYDGSATDLLTLLKEMLPESVLRDRRFPKDATRLSNELKRLASPLRRQGIEISHNKGAKGKRSIKIAPVVILEQTPVASDDISNHTSEMQPVPKKWSGILITTPPPSLVAALASGIKVSVDEGHVRLEADERPPYELMHDMAGQEAEIIAHLAQSQVPSAGSVQNQ